MEKSVLNSAHPADQEGRLALPRCVRQTVIAVLYALGVPSAMTAQTMAPVESEGAVAIGAQGMFDWDATAERDVTQLVWHAPEGRLVRQTVRLLDLFAGENLEIRWIAEGEDEDGTTSPVRPTGPGRIDWRASGRPFHDRTAWVASYDGTLLEGRPEGVGHLRHRSGLRYSGAWRDGRFHGEGHLVWPNGQEYRGVFEDGLLAGLGRLYFPDGSIHIGAFANGEPEGAGMVLPLTARAYIAKWAEGAEVAGTRMSLDGTSGIAHVLPVQQATTEVRLTVAVDPQEAWGNWDVDPLGYTGLSDGPVLRVLPASEDFVGRWLGDEPLLVRTSTGFMYDGISFRTTGSIVALNVGIENTSLLPQQVIGGYLDVQSSRSNLRPALEILNADGCTADITVESFSIQNYGWSNPTNARIVGGFDLPNSQNQILPISQPLANAWPRNQIDFQSFFTSLGGQINDFRTRLITCVGDDYQGCLLSLQQQGAFGELSPATYVLNPGADAQFFDVSVHARFSGALEYDWQTSDGRIERSSQRFSVRFRLARFRPESGCGEGGSGLQQLPDTLSLRLDQGPYRLPFNVLGTVNPGFVQTWRIPLDAPRSSFHDFSIVLQLADGREVRSRPISLTYFRSSTPAQY